MPNPGCRGRGHTRPRPSREMVLDFGSEVVGPAAKMDEALRLASQAPLDAAILDVNVGGVVVVPVADVLQQRGIPIIFATGYGEGMPPSRFAHHPTLSKPFDYHRSRRRPVCGRRVPTAAARCAGGIRERSPGRAQEEAARGQLGTMTFPEKAGFHPALSRPSTSRKAIRRSESPDAFEDQREPCGRSRPCSGSRERRTQQAPRSR